MSATTEFGCVRTAVSDAAEDDVGDFRRDVEADGRADRADAAIHAEAARPLGAVGMSLMGSPMRFGWSGMSSGRWNA